MLAAGARGIPRSVDVGARQELLLGCGSSRERRLAIDGRREWSNLLTVDLEPRHGPDMVHNLAETPWPFADGTFDEVHAYEVLEHIGKQGDFASFFDHFFEVWRILKPGGFLAATSPSWRSMWAWGDPGHTRVLTSGSLVFLDQEEYHKQVGRTPMSDYRRWWGGDFRTVWVQEDAEAFRFVLEAVKPARNFGDE